MNKTAFTWQGIFDSFAAADADPNVFAGSEWVARISDKAQRDRARSVGGTIPPVATTTEYALPFVAALATRRDRPLRILDFGGGMGSSYVPLRAMLPREQEIDFVVVETAAVSDAGNALFADDPGIRFQADFPAASERFDIVHFGSSLHYVDDWKGLLESATRLSPAYLLVADLTAGDNLSFVTTQHYQDRRIPVRFWNVDEFVSAVSALGFDLLLKARYRGYYLAPDAELPTSNFDEAHRLTHTSQFVFRRTRANPED